MSSKPSRRLAIALCLTVVGIAAAVQTLAGAYEMTWRQALGACFDRAVWGHPGTLLRIVLGEDMANALGAGPANALDTGTLIVWNIRMPRLIVAALVGINLAVSGTIFQAVTRNDLASPYTLGVGAGSGLAIWLVLVIHPGLGPYLPVLAGLGGAVAFLVVYAIAWQHGTSPVRLVLAGVIVAAVAGSLQTALFFLARDLNVVRDAAAWLAGSLSGVGWPQVRIGLPWTILVLTLAFAGSRHLDLISLGDAQARALGVPVERTRFALSALAILAASTSISIAGHVSFVGLIVPHIVRNTVGAQHRGLLLGCLLAGPALLVSADVVARLALSPIQLPVGVITGLLGGIYFLYLMRRRRDLGR